MTLSMMVNVLQIPTLLEIYYWIFFIALLLSLFDALKYEKILFDFSISPSSG